jgi:hypothetical protein
MKPAIAKVSRKEPRPLRTRGNTLMRFLWPVLVITLIHLLEQETVPTIHIDFFFLIIKKSVSWKAWRIIFAPPKIRSQVSQIT